MTDRAPGALFIIGGNEDKAGDRAILGGIAAVVGSGRMVIATIASHQPQGYFAGYVAAFAPLGATNLAEVYIAGPEDVAPAARAIAAAEALFFTGGDQRRLVDRVAGTAVERELQALHARGGLVAGTSAGASALGEVMITSGPEQQPPDVADIQFAPGLALVPGVIIDQHFSERGRIARLVAALARYPQLIGIGIDEDTAIRVDAGCIDVLGSGNVTIIGGGGPHLAEPGRDDGSASVGDRQIHVLAAGDRFELPFRGCAGGAAPTMPAPTEAWTGAR